jgi:hypothetical protein
MNKIPPHSMDYGDVMDAGDAADSRGYESYERVHAKVNKAKSNAYSQSRAQEVEKAEACPTCSSTKIEPVKHGPSGASTWNNCKNCSRIFRAKDKEPIKKGEFGMDEGLGCPACSGQRVEHLGTLGTRDHFICKGCGMSFSHPREENAQAQQNFNDQDIEPHFKATNALIGASMYKGELQKSIYQTKCMECGHEQEKQGANRALESLSCSKCGEKGLKSVTKEPKKYRPSSAGPLTEKSELHKSLADIRKSAGCWGIKKTPKQQAEEKRQLAEVKRYKKANPNLGKKEIPQVEPATDEIDMPGTKTIKNVKPKVIEGDGSGSPTKGPDLKKVGLSTNDKGQLDREHGIETQNRLTGKAHEAGAKACQNLPGSSRHAAYEAAHLSVRNKDKAGKSNAQSQSRAQSVEKEEMGPNKFAQHKPTGKTDKFPKGSTSQIKGMLGKADGMDPGCTAGGDLQKAGIHLQSPNVGSSVAGHKVLPASTLPTSSQIPQDHRTAFLTNLIAKTHGTQGQGASNPKTGFLRSLIAKMHGAKEPNDTHFIGKSDLPGAGTGVATDDAGAATQSMKMSEKSTKGICPKCSSRPNERVQPHKSPIATPPCKDCGWPKVARGVRSNKEVEKAEYRPNGPCPTCGSRYAGDYCKECNHPRLAEGLKSQVAEKDRKANVATNKANWDKKVNKAELGGVPKAPTAQKIKAPTAATVKAPGVKMTNPAAPKPITPKVPAKVL